MDNVFDLASVEIIKDKLNELELKNRELIDLLNSINFDCKLPQMYVDIIDRYSK